MAGFELSPYGRFWVTPEVEDEKKIRAILVDFLPRKGQMKPAPDVPGNTPSERLSNALNMVLRVSKADLLKKEARLRRASEKKRATRKRAS